MHDYFQDESLEHYGVLGMKWGVRKDPQKAYNKSGKKLQKLDKKASKYTTQAQKSMEKAWEKNNSAQRAFVLKGIKKWRAAGQTNRTIKKYANAKRYESKAMRWQKSREKVFKDVKVNNLNPEYEDLGEKYSSMTLENMMANNTSMNSLYEMYERNKTAFNR